MLKCYEPSPRDLVITEGKIVSLSWRVLADTILTKQSRFISPGIHMTVCLSWYDELRRLHQTNLSGAAFYKTKASTLQKCQDHEMQGNNEEHSQIEEDVQLNAM